MPAPPLRAKLAGRVEVRRIGADRWDVEGRAAPPSIRLGRQASRIGDPVGSPTPGRVPAHGFAAGGSSTLKVFSPAWTSNGNRTSWSWRSLAKSGPEKVTWFTPTSVLTV